MKPEGFKFEFFTEQTEYGKFHVARLATAKGDELSRGMARNKFLAGILAIDALAKFMRDEIKSMPEDEYHSLGETL